jgi:hypothetical protein
MLFSAATSWVAAAAIAKTEMKLRIFDGGWWEANENKSC